MVTVEKPPSAPKVFSNLQKAIKAAPNGATITVDGRCTGPIAVTSRSDLTIEGRAPSQGGCPQGGLTPTDLTSTVAGGDTVIKVTSSEGIVIRFLNVVGGDGEGIEIKNSSTNLVACNCVARNAEGIEIDGSSDTTVDDNLVRRNATNGIRLTMGSAAAKKNEVTSNSSIENGNDGIHLEKSSTQNTVAENDVHDNGDDGVDLNHVTKNVIRENTITGNADVGILIEASNKNTVDSNSIAGNGDGLVDTSKCVSGSDNTGSNVPPACQ